MHSISPESSKRPTVTQRNFSRFFHPVQSLSKQSFDETWVTKTIEAKDRNGNDAKFLCKTTYLLCLEGMCPPWKAVFQSHAQGGTVQVVAPAIVISSFHVLFLLGIMRCIPKINKICVPVILITWCLNYHCLKEL